MHFRSSLAACAAGTLLLASAASAFDGNIQGFLLGAGIGPTFISTHEVEVSDGSRSASADLETEGTPIQFNWMIGGAWNPQNAMFYNNHISYYTFEGDDKTAFTSRGMLGYRHYMLPEGPSAYFEAGLGVAVFSHPEMDDAYVGSAFGIAGGYMFSPHYSVELGLDISNTESTANLFYDETVKLTSFYLSINALAF